MKNYVLLVTVLLCMSLGLNGCVVKNLGQSMTATFKGDYLLSGKKYDQGLKEFQAKVAIEPDNASAHYYLGRFELAQKKPLFSKALKSFKQAVSLNPGNTKYLFWLGVGYGAVNKAGDEQKMYRQVLAKQKNHLQALTYLGHNLLERGSFDEALKLYNKVLKVWPLSPSALFNRGLIMRELGRTPEEKQAWLKYLDVYPSGGMARRAADYLNALGEFQYRNQTLGPRTITIEKISFEPFTDKLESSSLPSLNLIGSVLSRMKNRELNILVFQKNNRSLGERRAKQLKSYLLEKNKTIRSEMIKVSWFTDPEDIKVSGGKIFKEGESVSFFIKKM